jgi:hypothetical protein
MPNRGIPAFVFSQKQSHTFLICDAFHAKGHLGKGISGISGMGIKQEIKKGMPIPPLDIHATDAAIAISSLDKGLEIQI